MSSWRQIGKRERLCFDGDALSWLNLQSSYDLHTAAIAKAKAISAEVVPLYEAA